MACVCGLSSSCNVHGNNRINKWSELLAVSCELCLPALKREYQADGKGVRAVNITTAMQPTAVCAGCGGWCVWRVVRRVRHS